MKNILLILICTLLFSCSETEEVAFLLKTDAKMNKGQFELVIQDCEQFLRQNEKSHRAWTLMGWAYLKSDSLKKAEECFLKSVSIEPKWENALVGMGTLRRKQGDLNGAREFYQKAISVLPENAEAFSSLLVIELLEGNYDKAVEYGEKSWSLRKNNSAIPANLSLAYHYVDSIEKRDAFFEEAKRLKYHRLSTLEKLFNQPKVPFK